MNPCLSHPLIAAGLMALVTAVSCGVLKLGGVDQIPAPVVATIIGSFWVSGLYYDREVGQHSTT